MRIICSEIVRRWVGDCVPNFSSRVMKSISGSELHSPGVLQLEPPATHHDSTDCCGSEMVTK